MSRSAHPTKDTRTVYTWRIKWISQHGVTHHSDGGPYREKENARGAIERCSEQVREIFGKCVHRMLIPVKASIHQKTNEDIFPQRYAGGDL